MAQTEKDETFFVYAHLRLDGTAFYIGKGRKQRHLSRASRSTWWKRIVAKDYLGDFPDTKILNEGLSEAEAFDLEKRYIQLFGRRCVDEGGILVNATSGGEGSTGRIASAETRQRLSESLKGEKHPNFGKSRPREVVEKIREANRHPSEETRRKKADAQRGRKYSEEARRKMSESAKRRWAAQESA